MGGRRLTVRAAVVLGCSWAVAACGSFGASSSSTEPDDGGGDASPPLPDGATDAASRPDASSAADASVDADAADAATACPGKDLALDRDNCGACGHMCSPYSPACTAGECEHLVFVTQTAVPANLNGLADADALCTTAASMSGSSRGNAPFKAWLSTVGADAAKRFVHGKRRYLDKQGNTIAANWDALVAGTLEHGIVWSENGNAISNLPVRTGTTPTGAYVGPSDCVGWTMAASTLANTYGLSGAVDGTWTQNTAPQTCIESAHLYCIEQ